MYYYSMHAYVLTLFILCARYGVCGVCDACVGSLIFWLQGIYSPQNSNDIVQMIVDSLYSLCSTPYYLRAEGI